MVDSHGEPEYIELITSLSHASLSRPEDLQVYMVDSHGEPEYIELIIFYNHAH